MLPALKANFSMLCQHPSGLGGGLTLRYIGGFHECRQNNCNGGEPARDVDAWYKVDLLGSYALKTQAGTTTLSLGINNLLNRNPPLIYVGQQGDSDGRAYDLIGRMIYARLAHRF